jgi:dephospho-CoA kinase
VPIIDGDDVAREVVEKGMPCLDALVKEFSDEILNEDGTLNRRKLADICFPDPKKKRRLDEITHPYIIKRMVEYFDVLHESGEKYCVVEAAALIESGLYAVCDKTIMVTADEEKIIKRIMKRDGLTMQQAQSRIDGQMDEEAVKQVSEVIITNNATKEEFCAKLKQVKSQLDSWFNE